MLSCVGQEYTRRYTATAFRVEAKLTARDIEKMQTFIYVWENIAVRCCHKASPTTKIRNAQGTKIERATKIQQKLCL